MTELLKCKCGEDLLAEWSLRAQKMDGGNVVIGPEASALLVQLIDESIHADRLAEGKAREALHHAFGLITEPGDWDSATIEGEIREALRLLEER